MISMIENDQRVASIGRAKRIAAQLDLTQSQQEILTWYISGQQKRIANLEYELPNAFQDLRATWFGKNHNRH